MARATVIVMDACGVGALPDAAEYGDPVDANTLAHVAEAVGGLDLPTLGSLGLGNITPIEGVPPVDRPVVHGRLHPLGPGKESTTGHWELMGVIPEHPLPTYPEGFPPDVVQRLEEATGHRFCCNRPYSGTEVIDDFGAAPPPDRRADPLHIGRLRAPARGRTPTCSRSPSSTPPARRRAW